METPINDAEFHESWRARGVINQMREKNIRQEPGPSYNRLWPRTVHYRVMLDHNTWGAKLLRTAKPVACTALYCSTMKEKGTTVRIWFSSLTSDPKSRSRVTIREVTLPCMIYLMRLFYLYYYSSTYCILFYCIHTSTYLFLGGGSSTWDGNAFLLLQPSFKTDISHLCTAL